MQVRGEVVSPLALPNEDAWLMRDGLGDFVATVRRGADMVTRLRMASAIGSTMLVTGVMKVIARPRPSAAVLPHPAAGPHRIWLSSKGPPWWTPLHLFVDGCACWCVATLAAVTLWTMLLRRQVHQKTRLLKESEGRFRTQAQQDALTGVASRAFLHERLEEAVLDVQSSGGLIALLMLDLDHFKQVNDTLGHQAGDELLCIVAHRIRSTVRKGDVVARMGGDEFVVLLLDVGDESVAEAIGAKLVANIAVPAEIGGLMREVSASVGVCAYPAGGTDGQSLLQHVDEAMYRAKARGRNSSCLYSVT